MGLASCAIVGTDGNEEVDDGKTYPDASNFEHVSLQTLLEEVPVPADYNVMVYVTEHHICPENWMCFVPDAITVAESPDSALPLEEQIAISVRDPRQFLKKVPYLFSVHASDHEFSDGGTFRRIRLLGYSRTP